MTLKIDSILHKMEISKDGDDPFDICPIFNKDKLKDSGAASIDLRIGSWFLTLSQPRVPYLDVYSDDDKKPSISGIADMHYRHFGKPFILHPNAFVLASTLEWIRLPSNMTAQVVGKSSWGRYGLIIATATGVHPGFVGCLTLELTNVGNVPIAIKPGTPICQIFLEEIESGRRDTNVDKSKFAGLRKPNIQLIELDEIAKRLSSSPHLVD